MITCNYINYNDRTLSIEQKEYHLGITFNSLMVLFQVKFDKTLRWSSNGSGDPPG